LNFLNVARSCSNAAILGKKDMEKVYRSPRLFLNTHVCNCTAALGLQEPIHGGMKSER